MSLVTFFAVSFPLKLPLLIDFSCCPARFSVEKEARQRGFCCPLSTLEKFSRKCEKGTLLKNKNRTQESKMISELLRKREKFAKR